MDGRKYSWEGGGTGTGNDGVCKMELKEGIVMVLMVEALYEVKWEGV